MKSARRLSRSTNWSCISWQWVPYLCPILSVDEKLMHIMSVSPCCPSFSLVMTFFAISIVTSFPAGERFIWSSVYLLTVLLYFSTHAGSCFI